MDIGQNGNILIGGTSYNLGTTEEDTNHSDIIVMEIDDDGNLIEEWLFDFGDNEIGNDIAYDRSNIGGFMICGSTDASRSFAISDFTPNPKFLKDMLAVRYYVNGSVADTNIFQAGYQFDDEFNSILFDNATNDFLVTGTIFLQGTRQIQFLRLSNLINTVSPWNSNEDAILNGPAVVSEITRINDESIAIIGTYNSGNDRLFLFRLEVIINLKMEIIQPLKFKKTEILEGIH